MGNQKVNEFAKENGYERAEYLCDWHGFRCYEPILSEGRISFVGLPLLIFEDALGNLRMSTPEEAMQRMAEMR